MKTIDIPILTEKVAQRIASGQKANANRLDVGRVRRACLKMGYSLDQAQRAVEDTCELAALYRNAS